MADKDEVFKLLTTYTKEREVPLPECGATLVLQIPGSKEMVAASVYSRKHSKEDLLIVRYVFRNHVLEPDVSDMTDPELDDMIAAMHIDDTTAIIVAFFDVKMDDVDPETVQRLFREMDQGGSL